MSNSAGNQAMSLAERAAELAVRTRLAVDEEQQELSRWRSSFEAELASARAQAAAELALARAEAAAELASSRAEMNTTLPSTQTGAQSEVIQLSGEIARLREDLARVQAEKATLDQAFRHAVKALNDLRKSRGYWLMRRLGRWSSLERGIRRVIT